MVQFGEKAIRGQFRDELVLDHRHVIDAAAADGVHRLLSGLVGPVHDLDAGFGGERLKQRGRQILSPAVEDEFQDRGWRGGIALPVAAGQQQGKQQGEQRPPPGGQG